MYVDPPWWQNRLFIRLAAMGLGVLGAILWPVFKDWRNHGAACNLLFTAEEVAQLTGKPDLPGPTISVYDCDYFNDCSSSYGDTEVFAVDMARGRGTSDPTYGYAKRLEDLKAQEGLVSADAVPALGEQAWVAEVRNSPTDTLVEVLVGRPHDGALAVRLHYEGAAPDGAKGKLVEQVRSHLDRVEEWFKD